MDYRPKEGILDGFWLRLRAGFVDSGSAGSATDFRIIVNHALPVF